ncbi:MAG: AI-2E family transporter [Bacteroidetes bacterium SW_11_45_7]|nr:MAG: AI-2E family transporter [Bacteroidetes bacterium SW_11_45_7]
MKRYPSEIRLLVYLLLIIISVFILVIARDFLIPVSLAILLSYLLYPLAKQLEQWHIHRIFANIIVILVAYIVIGGVLFVLSTLVSDFMADLPNIKEQAVENINTLEKNIRSTFDFFLASKNGYLTDQIKNLLDFSGSFIGRVFTTTTSTLAKFALLPIYIFLFLFYREKFHHFLHKLLPIRHHNKLDIILDKIKNITKGYMGGLVIVVIILAVLNSTGLVIIGLKHAILFGILAAIMNLIPYIGTIIGAALPFTFALIGESDPSFALGVVILFVIVQFIENNILTPNITGSQVNINPLITIMTVIAGGMIWGIAGMFIFLPFVAMFKVICENIDTLKPYAYLLGTQGVEQHSIQLGRIRARIRKWRSRGSL